MTPVLVAAAYNPAFAIPSAIQRAALFGDSGLPPRPGEYPVRRAPGGTERKVSTSSGWASTTRNRPPVPDRDGRLSAGEWQIAPLQVQGFGLAKRCAPEQLAAAVGQDPAGVSMLRTATVGTVVRSIRYRTASLAVL